MYAPTENADTSVKEQFYADLEVAIAQCGKNDLKVILGDFNAVTGSSRIQADHFPVLATLKLSLRDQLSLKASTLIPNLSSLSNTDVSWEYVANVSSKLRATSLKDQTLEAMGVITKVLLILAREVLGKRLCGKKPRISQATLAIIYQCRQAI